MDFEWENDFKIKVSISGGAAVISANRQGLLSLSNHLKALSEEKPGSHFHLDEWNCLEHGSSDLIVAHL